MPKHTLKDKKRILPKTISIPIGTVLSGAPCVVASDSNSEYYRLVIIIGKDNTADLIISSEALDALRDLHPQISIS